MKHLVKRRHDFEHDKGQNTAGHDDDDDGIDHGTLDLLLERLGSLHEVGQTLQNDFQRTARFARLDHVDVKAAEHFGMPGQGLRKGGTAFDIVADVHQGVLQPTGLHLHFEDFQAAKNRQPGVLKDGQLAGERDQHLCATGSDRQLLFSFSWSDRLGRFTALLRYFRNEISHLADGGLCFFLRWRFNDVADLLTRGVHRLKTKSWHGFPYPCSNGSSIIAGRSATTLVTSLSINFYRTTRSGFKIRSRRSCVRQNADFFNLRPHSGECSYILKALLGFENGFANNLLQRSSSLVNSRQTCVAQGDHSEFASSLTQVVRRHILHNQLSQLVVHHH